MAWTISACLAVIAVCLSACVVIQMRMIDSLFRSLSTEYRLSQEAVAGDSQKKTSHFSMYNNRKGDS